MIKSTSEQPQFKTCSNPDCPCDNPQPATNFYPQGKGSKYFKSICKTCENNKSKEYYWEHVETIRERALLRARANAEQHRINSRQWGRNNPDRRRENFKRWRKANPDYHLAWKRANPDRQRAMSQRRLARKRNLPDTFTAADWQHALNYFNGCCAVCGRPPGLWHTLAADHWTALSDPDCPGTIPTNIVPLCHPRKDGGDSCNVSKHNKNPEQWLVEKFGKRKAKKILARIQAYFDSLE